MKLWDKGYDIDRFTEEFTSIVFTTDYYSIFYR